MILSCVFDEHDLFDGFDNADCGFIAFRVGAYFTYWFVGNIVAFLAILNIFAHFANGRYEFVGIGWALTEYVQSHTESRFASDAR